jgi:hypothetical protein
VVCEAGWLTDAMQQAVDRYHEMVIEALAKKAM